MKVCKRITMTYTHREQWLQEGLTQLLPLFSKRRITLKYKIPTNIKVSCGWPVTNPLGLKRRTLGECWPIEASKGKLFEIFITPMLSDSVKVLDVLTHEIVHTIVPPKSKHGPLFKEVALEIGLTGKMTSTVAGPLLTKELERVAGILGKYPHQEMNPFTKEKKTRPHPFTTLVCTNCEYRIKVHNKYLELGYPTCPCGEEFTEGDS